MSNNEHLIENAIVQVEAIRKNETPEDRAREYFFEADYNQGSSLSGVGNIIQTNWIKGYVSPQRDYT